MIAGQPWILNTYQTYREALMIFFLLTFLFIYGSTHALVYWGLRPLLKGHPALPTLVILWMATMVLAPLLVRFAEHRGLESLARALAWVGFSWMGFVFIAFSLFLLLALWDATMRLGGLLLPSLTRLCAHGAISAILVLLIVIAASFYGLYEANSLQLETIRITTPKLLPGSAPIRIAQISDLHLGLIHRDEALAPIIIRLQTLSPDLIVATGDIVDAQINHLEGLADLWQQLNPPLGKYAITGNHEFYAGIDQAIDFLEQSGFRILRNEHIDLGATLKLVGVDDPGRGQQVDEDGALGEDSERFTLLLKHRPDVQESSLGLFDLQLSGHTHKGQIFPFTFLTSLVYPYQAGLYTLAKGSLIYTSRGTGTWGPPMRIGAPPEITLIELVPQDSQ
jgi:predicted MPP superfamily phosphohydrolase